jgi:hypothetical protein
MSPTEFSKNGVAASGSSYSIPSNEDAAKFFLSHLHFLYAGNIHGKDYLMGISYGSGALFATQTHTSGSIEKIYADARKKVEFQEAYLFPKNEQEIIMVFTHQPIAKSDGEREEKNFERSIEAGTINLAQGKLSAPKSLLPAKTYVDNVTPMRPLNEQEVLILGHTSRKDLTLSKVRW